VQRLGLGRRGDGVGEGQISDLATVDSYHIVSVVRYIRYYTMVVAMRAADAFTEARRLLA
jgi:hypothetical protein